MKATIRVLPIVRNLSIIASERALNHAWETHPTVGIEVDTDSWALRYQDQLKELHGVLTSDSTSDCVECGEDKPSIEKLNHLIAALRQAQDVVMWLGRQGYSVMGYSLGEGFKPAVQIAYSEAAKKELRLIGASIRLKDGKTIECFSALHNQVRIWWERESK